MRYLDTSSLVALYYPEAKTARLEAHLRSRQTRLPFTWLHGTRTFDLVHVAAASLLEAREFITSDRRQSELAEREGLNVALIL